MESSNKAASARHYVVFDRLTKEFVFDGKALLMTSDAQQAQGFATKAKAGAAKRHYISNLPKPYANTGIVEVMTADVGFSQ